MRLVDLTGSFEEGMWRYGPEFPPFEMQSATDLEEEGFAVQKVTISTHMGTHVDAPGHLISGGGLADTIPLDRFIGPAALLRIGDVGPAEMVTREQLQAAADALRPDDIAVVETGWSKHWYDVNFVSETPHLSLEAAHWLIEQRIKCFVWDAPMFVDPAIDVSGGVPPEQIPDGVMLRAGIPMIAPVQNLSAIISDRFWFIGLPMKIKNADGSPARCVAVEGWTVE
ncbi:MAG: cyclase family protein [Rhodospirillaceae bacterium]|nr:cyclase family protein [Rhodospirillaceae bacterium]